MANLSYPDFESPDFLRAHMDDILAFYRPRVLASDGGFRGCFLDDGTCYDPVSRQLVGSARYVLNYATAFTRSGNAEHREWAQLGLNFLYAHHRQESGAYAWLLEDGRITDRRVMAYGHAFVLLAAASGLRIDLEGSARMMDEVFAFLDTWFWDENAGAYFDERDASLQTLSPYRGQNANMHMCEALLAAYHASDEMRFLDRAERLARKFAVDLAMPLGGQIWEHYDANWDVDMTYNIDKPNDRYKPWGFQPGHQTEWAKLLLILNEARPDPVWTIRAAELFDTAMQTGWDPKYGGIVYGVAPDGTYCASEKYFWVQSESFATAWRLFDVTGEQKYRDHYHQIWQWSWDHLIDHKHGAWFRVRARDGSAMDNRKSPLGKTDYHTMGACWDVLSVMKARQGMT